ncbi:MAG: hypothetical protein JWN56_380 [Sphingobacteriales bacterium]|nr:hypothetical protein [Sphingobacteriales bacterium]
MRSPAVDRYIYEFDQDSILVMEVLRDMVFHHVPEIEENIKWRIPCYSWKGLLCYINKEKKSNKVVLGFIEGASMQDEYGIFNTDTSQIRKLLFQTIDDLNEEIIVAFLKQAVEINRTKTRNFLKIRKR